MIQPSGESIRHNKAIVDEFLDKLGKREVKRKEAQTPEDQAILRLESANKAVAQAVSQYYTDHPIATNLPELRKLILSIYCLEFCKWSQDDLVFIASIQQTNSILKKFGY